MPRPEGVDISKWQAHSDLSKPHGVEFVKLHDKADFIILRAGYGGSGGGAWTDERVHEYLGDLEPLLVDNPKPFTFYWYFRDDVSVTEQIVRFSDVVNRWKHIISLNLVVDAEIFVKTNTVSTQKIIDFQTDVEKNTGLLVDILYGRAGQLNEETTPGLPEVLPDLWIARYDEGLNEQTDQPWDEGGDQEYVEPRDYDEWLFWQYSSSGGGADYGVVSASIDKNVFNGTLEELRAKAKLDQPVIDPETDLKDFGLSVAEQRDNPSPGETVFQYDGNTKPRLITIQSEKGAMTKVTVKFEINGVRVLWRRRSYVTYSDWLVFPVDVELELQKEDKVIVTVEGPGPITSVKYVHKQWF